jgi:hypothetical protein
LGPFCGGRRDEHVAVQNRVGVSRKPRVVKKLLDVTCDLATEDGDGRSIHDITLMYVVRAQFLIGTITGNHHPPPPNADFEDYVIIEVHRNACLLSSLYTSTLYGSALEGM